MKKIVLFSALLEVDRSRVCYLYIFVVHDIVVKYLSNAYEYWQSYGRTKNSNSQRNFDRNTDPEVDSRDALIAL